MNDFLARPWLLLAAPLIYWVLKELLRPNKVNSWADFLPPELAERLLTQEATGEAKPPLIQCRWVFLLLTLLFTLALAGVGYVLKANQLPSEQQELVIIQYLSPLIPGNAAPQQQLATSQSTLIPLLNARKQGKTALIYYAGSAHLVSPTTADNTTLRQLFSLTHPSVMPLAGHQPEAAFRLAANLGQLANKSQLANKNRQGRLDWLWLTNQLPSSAQLKQLLQIKPAAANLYLVGLATSQSVITKQQAAFASLGITLLHPDELIDYFQAINSPAAGEGEENQQAIHLFKELGHWPLLAALMLLLWQYFEQPRLKLPFKKNPFKAHFWLLALLIGLTCQQPLQAASWQNLSWQSFNHQAWHAIQAGEGEQAAKLASRTDLKAHAEFLLGRYSKAAELFSQWQAEAPLANEQKQAELLFNTGTAWLLAEQPQLALESFNQAKALKDEWPELCFNRELAEVQLAKKTAPTRQELQAKCGTNNKKPSASKESLTNNNESAEQDWQPEENSSCVACQQLETTQEKQLQQLQEDPWRLLKQRFKNELRESQP